MQTYVVPIRIDGYELFTVERIPRSRLAVEYQKERISNEESR